MLRDFRPYNERTEAERGALWDNFIISERMKRSQNYRMELNFYYKILGHILLNILQIDHHVVLYIHVPVCCLYCGKSLLIRS